ncbi:MAG: hypothetical protein K9J27_02395 [Bacteroidales bacterium]|nr:hypothetical protein [Bacteroidales bacterium]MCF8333804.1 hypothetical protein [Bacteroidales bacterium]
MTEKNMAFRDWIGGQLAPVYALPEKSDKAGYSFTHVSSGFSKKGVLAGGITVN